MTDTAPRKIAIAANPYSGKKANRQRLETLTAALRAGGWQPVQMWDKNGLGEALADPDFAGQYRCVVAAGGDGTLLHVINARPPAPVAAYPMGNENLFARQFGLRADPAQLLSILESGHERRVDLGSCNGKLFTIVASAGFDGRVAHDLAAWRAQGDKLRRVGRLSYTRPILRAMFDYDYPTMRVTADGQTFTGCLVMVFNLPQYGLNMPLAPQADPHDGQLDYVIFERPGTMALAGYAMSVFMRRHMRRSDVHTGRARELRIECDYPVPIEIDGDPFNAAPANLRVLPGEMRLLVPPAVT
ncbi:MAG: hypothetical protein GC162_19330 [Planctomycetes bacterium]|nr:hypothetical protein [Planctomycetota bacterium]